MRFNNLNKGQKIIFNTLTFLGIIAAIYYIFNIRVKDYILVNCSYYFFIICVFLTNSFLILPARKNDVKKVPFYDIVAAICCFSIGVYFFINSYWMFMVGWVPPPSKYDLWLASIFIIFILECARRMGGTFYFIIALTIGAYPFYGNYMPGIFYGNIFPYEFVIPYYVFGNEGILGVPSQVIGETLIGFIIFSGVLIGSGAGEFFLNIAYALFGKFRGGLAKVAIVASGLFGSMSGSALSNVTATGSITIPAMIKSGYKPTYAAAIEACASTGGLLMPPIMGSVAFVMCTIINVSYGSVVKAAIIPALLYYFTLFLCVDFHSAKIGLKGVSKENLPSLIKTIKEGWIFLFSVLFIIWGLLFMRWERYTPFYAAFLLIILSLFNRKYFLFNPKKFIKVITSIGILLTQTMAIILPVGLIIGGLGITGVSLSLTDGIVSLGRENIALILLLGIFMAYIMGMAGMLISAYVFLSITLAPAIIRVGGFGIMETHLFIVYYCMVAVITPPVAACAIVAANIAGANAMKTAWAATRLGFALYFIPFYFLFHPELIMEGPILKILISVLFCIIGLTLVVGATEGYIPKLGNINLPLRILFFISGVLLSFPDISTTIIGFIIILVTIFSMILKKLKLKY